MCLFSFYMLPSSRTLPLAASTLILPLSLHFPASWGELKPLKLVQVVKARQLYHMHGELSVFYIGTFGRISSHPPGYCEKNPAPWGGHVFLFYNEAKKKS